MAEIIPLNTNKLYKLHISLNNIEPEIWREFVVKTNIILHDLHKIIQTIMGWTNSHLNQFAKDDRFYSVPNKDDFMPVIDCRKIRLNSLIKKINDEIYYEYDFGDGWEHTIKLIEIIENKEFPQIPYCIDGARNCPPEDCGGFPGYMQILEVLEDPKKDESGELLEWLGDSYDPDEFPIDDVNEMLMHENFGCLAIIDEFE